MQRVLRIGFLTAVALTLACASATDDTGPGAVVQRFYEHLNTGSYAAARGMYDAETTATLGESDQTAGFADWAQSETKRGRVDRVTIVEEAVEAETATVEFELLYSDGSTRRGSVTLSLENGEWRLGFIR